jgi:hypothetical protein
MFYAALLLGSWSTASPAAVAADIQRPTLSIAVPDQPRSRTECSNSVQVTGGIIDKSRGLSVDFTASQADVQISHNVDVDLQEDQCIAEVLITTKLEERGCTLTLRFATDGKSSGLPLAEALLEADSFCPGWSLANEGDYRWRPGWTAPQLGLSQAKVQDRIADRACIDLALSVDGDLQLANPGGRGTFAIQNFNIQGTFDSVGNPRQICPGQVGQAPAVAKRTPSSQPRTTGPGNENRYDATLVAMAGLDMGFYSYSLSANQDRNAEVVFGGQVTAPARAIGFTSFVRGAHDWYGGELRFRSNYASVLVGEKQQQANLSTYDLPLLGLARYDFGIIRPALRLGMSFSDIPIFWNGTETNPNAGGTTYGPMVVFSGIVGAEAEVKVFKGASARTWLDLRFARMSAYSQIGGGLEFSYAFVPSWFANLNMGFDQRALSVLSDDKARTPEATINDHMTRFTLEFGYLY